MANPLEHLSFNHIGSATVGTIVYPPGGRYGPRIQPDIQLVFLHTGSMEVAIDGVHFRLEPGNVALLKPGHIEYFTFADEQDSWHRWVASYHFARLVKQQTGNTPSEIRILGERRFPCRIAIVFSPPF
ncbi:MULTISPECIES: AraC family ligand binding domain-containing protein [unclassified Paenibacillus]|uniref:AraC family ligand binding domain-containing protein n=1 Tax=unclassified Paenibacillus TaxID=185978 RepID=UPI00278930C9|nr:MULTISPECIES: AraC family ligand binding domain-containing protein [unclassified Paenibacillus]MDQ0900356.1 hypothetical protein [Paenibacillus sp. V4I7]MDQ0921135.1 hypothetical protein [Paenibacillus sp. V4I5]